jgi:cholesterol transport system auxiliary component
MKKYILSGLVTLMITGCTTATTQPMEYKLTTDVKAHNYTSKSCKDKTIRIRDVFASSSLMSTDMKYAIGTNKELSYTQSKWVVSPNKILSAEILKSVRESGIFASVHNAKSRIYTNMTLEIDVEDFMQYYNKEKNDSFSKVVLNFTLIDNKTKKVVSTTKIIKTYPSQTLDAKGGVDALNLALDDVLYNSNLWLDKVCQ